MAKDSFIFEDDPESEKSLKEADLVPNEQDMESEDPDEARARRVAYEEDSD